MVKRSELPPRKAPIARATTPIKRTAIKRRSPIRTDEDRAKQRRRTEYQNKPDPGLRDGITLPEGLRVVRERAGGLCEVRASTSCTGVHEETHHRKPRRFRDHRPVNLLATCGNCHTQAEDSIHRNPLRAHEHGWLVWSYEDPLDVPVLGP